MVLASLTGTLERIMVGRHDVNQSKLTVLTLGTAIIGMDSRAPILKMIQNYTVVFVE